MNSRAARTSFSLPDLRQSRPSAAPSPGAHGIRSRVLPALAALALAGLAGLASAAPAAADAPGLTSAEFLKIEVGGRATAMAGAHTSVQGDLFALHYNPALIAHFQSPAIALQYTSWFDGIDQNYASAATRFGDLGVLAATINWVGYDDMRRTTVTSGLAGTTTGSFSASDYAASLTWARALSRQVDIGVTAKLIGTEIDQYSGTAFAADAGLRYAVQPNWNVGLSLVNLGTSLELDRSGSPLPFGLRGGTSLSLFDGSLLLSADVSGYRGSDIAVGIGAEYTWNRLLSLRLGYDSRNDDADEGLTAGVGFHYQGFDLDYAYTPFGDLGNAHRVSLAYAFDGGASLERAAAPSAAAVAGLRSPAFSEENGALAARRAAVQAELGLPNAGYTPNPAGYAAASTLAVTGPSPETEVRLDFRLIAGDGFPQAAQLASMAETRLKTRLRAAFLPGDRHAKASLAVVDGGEVFLAVSLYDGPTWLHTIQSRGMLRDFAAVIDETTERVARYIRTGDETLRFASNRLPASTVEVAR